jgi:hypothetical protein
MNDSGKSETANVDPPKTPSPIHASNANTIKSGLASVVDGTAPIDAEEPGAGIPDHQLTQSERAQQIAEPDLQDDFNSGSAGTSDMIAEVEPDKDEIDTEAKHGNETTCSEWIRSLSSTAEAEESYLRVWSYCSAHANAIHPIGPPHRISDSPETMVVSVHDEADQGSVSSEKFCRTGHRITERDINTPSAFVSRDPDDPPPIQEPHAPRPRFAHRHCSDFPRAFSARAPLRIKKWTKAALADAPTELLEEVLRELQERRKKLAASRRFQEGAKVQSAIEYLTAFQLSRQKGELQRAALTEHQKQVDATEDECRAYESETKRMIKERTGEQKTKREELVERHQQERRELNAQWNSRRNQRMYNRPSHRVAALRHQEALLAAQYRFEEANELSAAIHEHVRQELLQKSKARQEDYEQSLAKLKVKQQAEIESFDKHAKLEIDQLNQQRATQRRTLDNKVKKLEAKGEMIMDADRCWNAGFMQRQDVAAAGRQFGAALPSSHLNQDERERQEREILLLPPLNMEVGRKSARKVRRRRRQKKR